MLPGVNNAHICSNVTLYVSFHTCRFFPTAVYLSTSKLAVAAVGNLSFAMALCMYNLVIKVNAAHK